MSILTYPQRASSRLKGSDQHLVESLEAELHRYETIILGSRIIIKDSYNQKQMTPEKADKLLAFVQESAYMRMRNLTPSSFEVAYISPEEDLEEYEKRYTPVLRFTERQLPNAEHIKQFNEAIQNKKQNHKKSRLEKIASGT